MTATATFMTTIFRSSISSTNIILIIYVRRYPLAVVVIDFLSKSFLFVFKNNRRSDDLNTYAVKFVFIIFIQLYT